MPHARGVRPGSVARGHRRFDSVNGWIQQQIASERLHIARIETTVLPSASC
jgi:hypothetical protein